MKSYVVGGAVRDELLGRPVADRDHVVVGATAQQMLAAGFRPVGRDFPVFLHPRTQEEYALARTERKSAPGYRGFVVHAAPEVSLEEDLARRDLTINAMARAEDGTLIDPHGGARDLAARVLRHVGPAFVEDPVRILRVARFSARFADFAVAEETMALMRAMVDAGEADHLVPERVWQELARGLMEAAPARMVEVLRACGLLARLLPELNRLWGVPQPAQHHPEIDTGVHVLMALDCAARENQPLAVRYAVLLHDLGKGTTPADELPKHHGHEARSAQLVEAVSARLKVPADCRDLAILVAREHGNLRVAAEMQPATVVKLFERCDALRRPERFEQLIAACACDYHGRSGFAERPYMPGPLLGRLLAAVRAVDAGAIARACTDPGQIAARVHAARVAAVRAAAAG